MTAVFFRNAQIWNLVASPAAKVSQQSRNSSTPNMQPLLLVMHKYQRNAHIPFNPAFLLGIVL